MSGKGIFLGAIIGLMITRTLWGAVIGAILGYMLESTVQGHTADAMSISDEFFRTTFELMGHVAKSDGRVSEAEIDAARGLMQDLNLGPYEVGIAIERFRAGKAPGYDAELAVERLREACGQRHDLLRAFMELQLRAALSGNGMSPPARAILMRVAGRLGMSGVEFAYMEAALRARQSHRGAGARRPAPGAGSLAECYAELEIDSAASDQEVVKAFRRHLSRHHPDKLVANGLPESMAQMAKEKTQRIQEAYEEIRAARGMR